MYRNHLHMLLAFVVALILLSALLVGANSPTLLASQKQGEPGAVLAGQVNAPAATMCYATADNGTTVFTTADASAVDQAIDAAPVSGTVKVAGTCTGVAVFPNATQFGETVTATVLITKNLTLRGGYTTTNWTTSDLAANPTTLDAQQGGSVVSITAGDRVVLENLRITNGRGIDAREGVTLELLGVEVRDNRSIYRGAGVFFFQRLIVRNSLFANNRSEWSGGAIGGFGALDIADSTFISNTAGSGGAIYTVDFYVFEGMKIARSRFENNHATSSWGGAIYSQNDLVLEDVQFIGNSAATRGGAVFASAGFADVTRTRFENNQGSDGGGLYIYSGLAMTDTVFLANHAEEGGGLYILGYNAASPPSEKLRGNRLVNVLFARNSAEFVAEAVLAFDTFRDDVDRNGQLDLIHTTVTSPTVSSLAAIFTVGNMGSTINITNSIIANHDTGVWSSYNTAVNENYNLFFGNNTDRIGVSAGANSLTGDPAFVNPGADDYRLGPTSAALSQGTDLGIATDLDGDPRPQPAATGPDLGAYESKNRPPNAVDDTATVDQNSGQTTINVLTNDSDQDGDPLQITAVGTPNQGSSAVLMGSPATSIGYTPKAGFSGSEVFTYTLSDGVATDSATVTVTVRSTEADSTFRPSQHGYSFANWNFVRGDTPSNQTITAVIEMFGADKICVPGTLTQNPLGCELNLWASQIWDSTLGTETYGKAYGMAVTSLRFFMGSETPVDIVGDDINTVPDLSKTNDLEVHINRYALQQYTVPNSGPDGWARKVLAGDVIALVNSELGKPMAAADPYILLLFAVNGAGGHTVVPYRVANPATDRYEMYVYDSNYPLDDTRKIVFDLTGPDPSWTYSTTDSVSDSTLDLNGSDATSRLDLRKLSGHQPTGLTPIGVGTLTQVSARDALSMYATGQTSYSGLLFETDFCWTSSVFDNSADSNGNCNDITKLPHEAGGFRVHIPLDGLGVVSTSLIWEGWDQDVSFDIDYGHYAYPLSNRSTLATGTGLDLVTNLGNGIEVAGAGAAAGVVKVTVGPDAQEVVLKTDATSGAVPDLLLTVPGPTPAQPYYEAKVSGVQLAGGSTMTGKLDITTGRLFFQDDDSNNAQYTIAVTRTQPNGAEEVFERSGIELDGDAAYLDLGNWDGGESVDLVVDDEGDGFANDTPTPVTNQYEPPPVAVADGLVVAQDSRDNVVDVLANDSDPGNDPLTITAVTTPDNGGSATISTDAKSILYTSKAGFVGFETFDYTVSDGKGKSATATVTIRVVEPAGMTEKIFLPGIERQ